MSTTLAPTSDLPRIPRRTGGDRYDLVVVGARVAGAALALLTARAGQRVLVVDRADAGSDTLSTHALMRPAVGQLARWGVLPAIVAAGTPPVRDVVFHYGDQRVPVAIERGGGADALYAPRRTVLDAALVDAARTAGAEVRFGITVTGLCHDPDGRVAGVTGRDRDGAPAVLHAPLTVGADGIRSIVARVTGAPATRTGEHAAGFVYGYWRGVETSGCEWFYRPGASAGLVPTNGDEVCVFVGVPAERFRREAAGDLERALTSVLREVSPEAAARVAGGERVGRVRGFGGLPGYLRRASGPGWALVGDAGHFTDPATAHGISAALRDAELLARAVVDGNASDSAMRHYEATRDGLSLDVLRVGDALASYRWTLGEVGALLRELAAAIAVEAGVLAGLAPVPATVA